MSEGQTSNQTTREGYGYGGSQPSTHTGEAPENLPAPTVQQRTHGPFLMLLLASRRPTRKIHVRHQPTHGAKTISTTGMYLHTKYIYVSSRLSSPS